MTDTAIPAGLTPGPRFDHWSGRAARYVVCDVDGTLVGPHPLATDEVVAAVRRAREAGVTVGYATGRMRDGVRALHTQLELPGPHVLHNGAEVRAEGTTVAAWTLSPTQIDGLLAIASVRTVVYVELYPAAGFMASAHDERARPHWELLGSEPTRIIRRARDLGDEPVLKATFAVFDPSQAGTIVEAVEALGMNAGPAGSPRTPGLVYVNATHPEADKGRAVAHAARHLGVDLADVAAIGDADNDRSMLEIAGTAIAMGQAPDEVRALAHLIAPDVAEDGVAVALDALVAGQPSEVASP
ncbi:MAG: HAD family phosphatase [Nitriliruptoraceae bacterium]|nr:HAD family phosphatase [Nitriliruptoraceae bacterium]